MSRGDSTLDLPHDASVQNRWICGCLLVIAVFGCTHLDAETPPPEPRRVRQTLHEYMTLFAPTSNTRQQIKPEMNPFLSYTHLGTDFGFIGAGINYIGWEPSVVDVAMPKDEWGGMWHGLEGMGDEKEKVLDFRAAYPAFITAKFQPKIVGIEFRAKGKGELKLEIKTANQVMRWSKSIKLDTTDVRDFVTNFDPEEIKTAKYVNWVAEGGTEAALHSISFIVEAPAIPFDEYVFLASYAKLARCYSAKTGFVKDRAHSREGQFDNVPATGLFALASAIAATRGIVSEEMAQALLKTTHDKVTKLTGPSGLLPHFVREDKDKVYHIMPGTEFSVVDTSLYYHALLLAAKVLKNKELEESIVAEMQGIALEGLVDGEGYIKHGIRDDGVTQLPGVWKDWGGETALVLAMATACNKPIPPKMDPNGRVYQGTGFIPEIQSLFYPDFDDERPDGVTHKNWHEIRTNLLAKQKAYFPTNFPAGHAAKHGFYGLSAGEAKGGFGYFVGGADLKNQELIHPHYVLMSGCMNEKASDVYAVLRSMESENLFPPWGMVENFTQDTLEYLPMLGALNASLECISAYHLMMKSRAEQDLVYTGCRESALLRRAVSIFYKPVATVSSN